MNINYTSLPKEIWWDIFFFILDNFEHEYYQNKKENCTHSTIDIDKFTSCSCQKSMITNIEYERNKCFRNIAGVSTYWHNITANNKTFLKKYFAKYFKAYSSTPGKTLNNYIREKELIEIKRYALLTDVLDKDTHFMKFLEAEKERLCDKQTKCVFDENFNVRDDTDELEQIDLKSETDKLLKIRDKDIFVSVHEVLPKPIDVNIIKKNKFSKKMRQLLSDRRENLYDNNDISDIISGFQGSNLSSFN